MMKIIQYRYPFATNSDGIPYISQGSMTDTRYTHIGIQLPYRPFIMDRASSSAIDIIITSNADDNNMTDVTSEAKYVVNLPGVIEFDDVNLRRVKIQFNLTDDMVKASASNKNWKDVLYSIMREAIVDIGYEKLSS